MRLNEFSSRQSGKNCHTNFKLYDSYLAPEIKRYDRLDVCFLACRLSRLVAIAARAEEEILQQSLQNSTEKQPG